MRLQKIVLLPGDQLNFPTAGDSIKVHYTGWLYQKGAPDDRGQEIDSSQVRGEFHTTIGVAKVIKGWDILIPQMSLGERSILHIPSTLAYGSVGFPGCIPADAALVFQVQLLQINNNHYNNINASDSSINNGSDSV